MKNCIAVLTRGYEDSRYYDQLIKRNECIDYYLNDKTIDILIFHEGNITRMDQKLITSRTPNLRIRFININNGHAFKKEKEKLVFRAAPNFKIGYRHMCSFWFVNFWSFVKDYDCLLRIDEDCIVQFNIDSVFETINHTYFLTGRMVNDEDDVTVGLNDLTRQFLQQHSNLTHIPRKYPASGPYTNVFGINLQKVKHHKLLMKYIKKVDQSNGIYLYRWGDLPLWGEVIDYLFDPDAIQIDNQIKYYHESHHIQVNGN